MYVIIVDRVRKPNGTYIWTIIDCIFSPMAEWEGAEIWRLWINFGLENGKLVEWSVWSSSLLDLLINGTYICWNVENFCWN